MPPKPKLFDITVCRPALSILWRAIGYPSAPGSRLSILTDAATKPLFIIVFAMLALIGGGARIKYAYDESMERHQRERAEAMRATTRANVESRR